MIVEYSFDENFKKLFKKLERSTNGYAFLELEGIGSQLDINEFSRKFFGKKGTVTADVSVDANSNVDEISVVHYNNEIAKPIQRLNAYYLMWKYAKQLFNEDIANEMVEKQFFKRIYIHDFHGFHGIPYCFNFSLTNLIYDGINFAGQTKSKPANHLSSFIGHVIAFVTYSCNNVLGACGLSDFLICSSFYIEKLFEEYKDIPKYQLEKLIKQEFQSFIFSVNQPFRSSIQTPFTNISIFDDIFLNKLCDEYIFPEGKKVNKETVKYAQKLFLNLMNETLNETPITFPIITACIATDKKNIIDDKFLDFISEQNLNYGFINIYAGNTSTFSSCCRMRSDSKSEYFNSFGSGSTQIGSQNVTTLNLPRLAYISKNEQEFFNKLEEDVILATRINQVKRFIIQKRIDNDNAPLYKLGFMSLNRQYSTCGLTGIYECCEIMGYDILTNDGQNFVIRLLNLVNTINDKQSKHYNVPINCEQIPGEQSCIKLAKADKLLGYNKNYIFYSNQFIPLIHEADMLDRIKLQGKFDALCTGGAIQHLNIVDRITSKEYMKKIIKLAIENGVIYHAINYNLQSCKNNHLTVGKKEYCPVCEEKIVENRTRIVGYLTNVKLWNDVRREKDYKNRKWYNAE